MERGEAESKEFEALFRAENGNVRTEFASDAITIRFVASPPKMRALADAIIRAADEADSQMPGAPK